MRQELDDLKHRPDLATRRHEVARCNSSHSLESTTLERHNSRPIRRGGLWEDSKALLPTVTHFNISLPIDELLYQLFSLLIRACSLHVHRAQGVTDCSYTNDIFEGSFGSEARMKW